MNYCIWQGNFKLNVPMGHGTYTWLDGSTYEGELHQGVRHGVGVFKCFKTSTVYRGQWHLGKRQGQVCAYTHLLSQLSLRAFNNIYLDWCPVMVTGGNVL